MALGSPADPRPIVVAQAPEPIESTHSYCVCGSSVARPVLRHLATGLATRGWFRVPAASQCVPRVPECRSHVCPVYPGLPRMTVSSLVCRLLGGGPTAGPGPRGRHPVGPHPAALASGRGGGGGQRATAARVPAVHQLGGARQAPDRAGAQVSGSGSWRMCGLTGFAPRR
jgi:hypothetical protein